MWVALQKELEQWADPGQKEILQRFFKTAKGEYGEGDIFLGVKVPMQRKLADKYCAIELEELPKLLQSQIHECRFTALLLLIQHYAKGDMVKKSTIFNFYVDNLKYVNNWDLVDLSAPPIVGDYLQDKSRKLLYQWATSGRLWERRIAIVATLNFIKNNDFSDTLQLAKILLHDEHDLIHKAVGWMLREVGKRNLAIEESFLGQHYKEMPRTMLRSAIERLASDRRQFYLKG